MFRVQGYREQCKVLDQETLGPLVLFLVVADASLRRRIRILHVRMHRSKRTNAADVSNHGSALIGVYRVQRAPYIMYIIGQATYISVQNACMLCNVTERSECRYIHIVCSVGQYTEWR